MIHDLDETLKELLVREVPLDPHDVEIDFEAPTKGWATGAQKPTVNLFLYDVRENLELRSNERAVERRGGLAHEKRPPVRVDITYMITVWSPDVGDEHRLLSDLLSALLRHPVLPEGVLKGAMREQCFPLRAWIAQPDRTPNAWDFWSSIDGRLKAGISYVVTAAWEPHAPVERTLVTESVVSPPEEEASP